MLRRRRAGDADEAVRLMSEHIRVPQRRLHELADDELRDILGPPRSPSQTAPLN